MDAVWDAMIAFLDQFDDASLCELASVNMRLCCASERTDEARSSGLVCECSTLPGFDVGNYSQSCTGVVPLCRAANLLPGAVPARPRAPAAQRCSVAVVVALRTLASAQPSREIPELSAIQLCNPFIPPDADQCGRATSSEGCVVL
jgi:hypothetical protein